MTLLSFAQAATSTAPDDAYLMWGFILFGVAIVLLAVELFVPSGGLIGILCGVAAVGSVVAFFQHSASWGAGAALAYVILAPIVLVFVFKLWINSPLARTMILGGAEVGADAEDATAASERARQERFAELRALVGAEGETDTALRPVGTVRIGDRRIDAMAESGVIPANTPIVVTDVYDNQIKVRPKLT